MNRRWDVRILCMTCESYASGYGDTFEEATANAERGAKAAGFITLPKGPYRMREASVCEPCAAQIATLAGR